MKISELEAKADKARTKVKGREYLKVGGDVFDRATLLTLYYLANKGVIDILRGTIKTGKESNVFLAECMGKQLAVKIHRITTSDYRGMLQYIDGDYRFEGIRRNKRNVVYTWVKKEYKNLGSALKAGVTVPKPLAYKNNVLVMEFVGTHGVAAHMLKHVWLENPKKVFDEVVEGMHRLYCGAKLVHSDLSEYNILMRDERPVLIDLSHAVVKAHPLAEQYLERDVGNIARFFQGYLKVNAQDIMERVRGC